MFIVLAELDSAKRAFVRVGVTSYLDRKKGYKKGHSHFIIHLGSKLITWFWQELYVLSFNLQYSISIIITDNNT